MSNFREQIYDTISEQLGVEKEKITPEALFADDLNAGETEMEELHTNLQEKLKIEIDPLKSKEASTVEELVNIIFNKLNGLVDEE